jgi:hypothetical protein
MSSSLFGKVMLTNLTAVEDALTDEILGAYPRWISLG